jgi:uncharacterized DUF497 family protein
MDIHDLLWDDWNTEHIDRHHVSPDEVDEVCLGMSAYVSRAGRTRYQIIGPSYSGRLLVVFLDRLETGVFYPVTARDASDRERRLFQRKRGG